ncbi:MAG TPA: ATP-binding protein [Mycobacteriales bacterium]|nr:ATP-binding protein [Mycobacteriales bacterium]
MDARRRTSLAGRLRSTLLVTGLLQLLAVAVALGVAVETREEQRRLSGDIFTSVQDSHAGFVRALDLDDAAADYLRRGEPDDLATFQLLVQPRPGAVTVDDLRDRLRGEDRALEALEEVRVAYVTWLEELTPLVAAVEAGGPQSLSPAQLQANDDHFTEVRTLYDEFVDEVLRARDSAADHVAFLTRVLFVAVLASVATAVVAGLLLYAALRTWVILPVQALASETRTVRSGQLDHEVKVDGPPDIVELADDVEAMRRGLVEQLAALERTREKQEQQAEELRRSNRDLEQFAYVASHDLQEPLRKVSSFCQMLERRYKGQLDERADQYIEFAVDGAKRMQLLINDLLAFSRVGRMSDGSAEVDMDGVVAEALRNLSTAVEESGAVVTSEPLPVVHGERRLLVQLLQNLIGNAVKFAGDEPPRVRIEVQHVDDCWEFAVTDNGIGIEPQYAERIFVIFQRLHAKSEYAGTGIGLALCKKIVEHHGGSIWLDPTPGPGTTFRWRLPVGAPVGENDGAEPLGSAPHSEAPQGAEREAACTATSR